VKLQIIVEGKTYEVEVELLEDDGSVRPTATESHHPASDALSHSPATLGIIDDEGLCRSPVTGLVIKVNVEPGQQVEAGDLIVVFEAMKMETNMTAPREARVKKVLVAPGDPVKMNQVAIEFE